MKEKEVMNKFKHAKFELNRDENREAIKMKEKEATLKSLNRDEARESFNRDEARTTIKEGDENDGSCED